MNEFNQYELVRNLQVKIPIISLKIDAMQSVVAGRCHVADSIRQPRHRQGHGSRTNVKMDRYRCSRAQVAVSPEEEGEPVIGSEIHASAF